MTSDGSFGKRWCILRTSGGRTLALAASLAVAGFDVWTPVEKRVHKLRAGKTGKVERTFPLMPTFVFAQVSHLPQLAEIIALPVNPHPPFSIFRYMNRIPVIRDDELQFLRNEETRAAPKAMRPTIPIGTKVRATEGPFMGMTGKVEESRDGYTMVFFGGWMRPKIETLLLSPEDVNADA